MKKLSAVVTANLLAASSALASEATGTEGVGEMSLTGGQFMMLVGALVGLGLVIFGVAKVANRKK